MHARRLLDATTQQAAAEDVVAFVLDLVPVAPGSVGGYVAHAGELDCMLTLTALADRGWSLALPVCGDDATMEFCPWQPGERLEPNRYGIGEPSTGPLGIDSIDVVLVPGVGFDPTGTRIGHGVGYYDRYFARCLAADHDPLRLALAHDLQVVELPTPESWDVPMHRVITPSKVLDTASCA
jgi:5-formyltetrahydrofolate cyclo-ligase